MNDNDKNSLFEIEVRENLKVCTETFTDKRRLRNGTFRSLRLSAQSLCLAQILILEILHVFLPAP